VILERFSNEELQHIVVICGSGNNGGDGYAIARHLFNRGLRITLVPITEPKTQDTVENATIANHMQIPCEECSSGTLEDATIIIDAILGTGIDSEVRTPAREVIAMLSQHSAKIVSIDVPSGLDCNTGQPLGICVKASLTITFIGLKQGFMQETSLKYLGDVAIVDIGCPQALIKKYASSHT
jgi:NAD(P)H-hydrate epimerase